MIDAFGVSKLLGPSKDPKVKHPVVIHDPKNYQNKKLTKPSKPLPPRPKGYLTERSQKDYKAATISHPDPDPALGKDWETLSPEEKKAHFTWRSEHDQHVEAAKAKRVSENVGYFSDIEKRYAMRDAFGVEKGMRMPRFLRPKATPAQNHSTARQFAANRSARRPAQAAPPTAPTGAGVPGYGANIPKPSATAQPPSPTAAPVKPKKNKNKGSAFKNPWVIGGAGVGAGAAGGYALSRSNRA
jgi:hypothetical protein